MQVVQWNQIKGAFRAWREDHASYLAAAVAYHAIFSLAPLFLVLLAIIEFAYQGSSRETVLSFIGSYTGADVANLLEQLLSARDRTSESVIALIFGIALTLFGSIGVFKQLKQAVNLIWSAQPPKCSWPQKIIRYAALFALVLLTAALVIASLVSSAILSQGTAVVSRYIGVSLASLLPYAHAIVAFALTSVLFGVLLKILPDARIRWTSVWMPALITTLLFNIGKFALGFYLGHTATASAFGAAGSLVALLIWIFYGAQIFLFGVELVKQVERPQNGRIN